MASVAERIAARRAGRPAQSVADRIAARRAQRPVQGPPEAPQVPDGMFLNPNTGQMTSRELLQGAADPTRAEALQGGLLQGFSMGTMDELAGAVGTAMGGPDQGNFRREQARAKFDAMAEEFPGTNLAGEVVGSVTSPIAKLAPGANTVRKASVVAAGTGAVDGFTRGEGGVQDRVVNAAKGATIGLFSGGLLAGLGKGASSATRRLFQRAETRPSVENLRAAKTAAYRAVDNAGETFSSDEMTGLAVRAIDIAEAAGFDDIADPQTKAILGHLERRSGETVTMARLDKMRRHMWDRYNRSGENTILDLIGAVDEMVGSRAGTSELMGAAREANSRFAKAQLLENAFHKAQLQTGATGSGGNILNKYRQAIVRVITTPSQSKWFSADEIAIMEQFVTGDMAENTARRIGKLAPGGNGLMTALNVYAAAVDPTMLAVSAVASAAKGGADRSAMRGSERVLDVVSTGNIPAPPAPMQLNRLAVGGAVGGNRLAGR